MGAEYQILLFVSSGPGGKAGVPGTSVWKISKIIANVVYIMVRFTLAIHFTYMLAG